VPPRPSPSSSGNTSGATNPAQGPPTQVIESPPAQGRR
jgi:hypothetical protein